jgi:putative flippase GtrA
MSTEAIASRRVVAIQAGRFLAVGGGSYLFNLGMYALGLKLGLHYLTAAVVAYACGYGLNFFLNRHWTFEVGATSARGQFLRFTVVSLVALAIDLILLRTFVEVAGLPRLPAQALAVAIVAPLSFVGNRLWSFRR